MADFLEDFGGVNAAAGAFKGFSEALQSGEDRKMKKMELDAHLKAQEDQRTRQALIDKLSLQKAGYTQGPTGDLQEAPYTQRQLEEQDLAGREKGILTNRDEQGHRTFSYDPSSPQMVGARAKVQNATTSSSNQGNKFTDAFRDDWLKNPVTQNTQKVVSAYKNVATAAKNPSAAGDLSLIFAYMKMLDPGSTVREGEFANAQNAASIPDQVRNAYNKAQTGQRLNPTQRNDFVGQARKIYHSQMAQQDTFNNSFSKVAQRRGANPDDIVLRDMFVVDDGGDQESGGLLKPQGLVGQRGLIAAPPEADPAAAKLQRLQELRAKAAGG